MKKISFSAVMLSILFMLIEAVHLLPISNPQSNPGPRCNPRDNYCENPPNYPDKTITTLLENYKPLPGQFDSPQNPGSRNTNNG